MFTFEPERQGTEELNSWIVTKKGNALKGQRRIELKLPAMVEAEGIKIFIFETRHMDDVKKRLGTEDEKNIITALLKRRHLLPHVYTENDPYLIKEIPDIIFSTGGKESFFFNYKGVSVISVTDENGFLVNLKTREYEEVRTK